MTDAPGFAGVERRWGDDAIQVVVAEDESLLRRQLVLALERHPRIEVTAEAVDLVTVTAVIDHLPPHVVVLDARLPPDGAAAAVAALRARHPALGVVVIIDRAGVVPDVPRATLLSRQDVPDRLGDAVAAVAGGDTPDGAAPG
ncbi:MAG: hypothetical protein MUE36_00665 [Acidimicrobiales bacterium]|nr:hypothetical protein [Acidimicrobiales bacterium]